MTAVRPQWMRSAGSGLLVFFGLLVILVLTLAVFGLNPATALPTILSGAFGSPAAWGRTLARSTPLILCGLGLTLAWRAAVYNIGGEGQYVMGGIGSAAFFKLAGALPAFIFQPAALLCGAALGGLTAAAAAWLQAKRGVQVVISTILLNFIALNLLTYLVSGPLQESTGRRPLSDRIPADLALWRADPRIDLHAGFLIALAAGIALQVWLFGAWGGFRLRLVGENARAARAVRIPAEATQMKAMLWSGMLCGLAGAVSHLAMTRQIGMGFAEGWGFLAIPVALLGGLAPMGVVFAGLYFGALVAGCEVLARSAPIGNTLVYVIQAAGVLGFMALFEWQKRRELARRPALD
ncbi:MAG: ABC transporter permease [Fimbriimonadaceae bacterium]|nr:ABC transporter permease [Fimbriimonadaceae bacterium]